MYILYKKPIGIVANGAGLSGGGHVDASNGPISNTEMMLNCLWSVTAVCCCLENHETVPVDRNSP